MNKHIKNIALIVIIILSLYKTGHTQQVWVGPHVESTVAGMQYGAHLLLKTKSNWNIGGFYQASMFRQTEIPKSDYRFYGISLNAPLIKSDKINFYLNTRAGVVNKAFLVIVPGLETEIKILKLVNLSSLVSFRMSHPSVLLRASIKI